VIPLSQWGAHEAMWWGSSRRGTSPEHRQLRNFFPLPARKHPMKKHVLIALALIALGYQLPDIVSTETVAAAAANRVVCDANKKVATDLVATRCGSGIPATRKEGGAASGVSDVDKVYDAFGATSALYARLGYDLTSEIGVDRGDGKALRGTVRLCLSRCPWGNAFWSPSDNQMYFGEGLTTLDVTAHELTHGVTGKISKLGTDFEAAAINESLSDIFGEFTDLATNPDKPAAKRWKMGEDLAGGAFRDMSNPESLKHPGTYKGPNWSATDSHADAGVGNKLAFLTTEGGSYNGQTVTGLGFDKALRLWWKVQNTLTAKANYAELGRAINSSCTALAFTSTECADVAKAVKAVKIS
ncbi:M4 family peptidase, partial [Pseudonocardiaceae bacterium YIM PH 21723]